MPREKKIVFILGAGFSADAGAPNQSEILEKILARNTEGARELKIFLDTCFGHSTLLPLEDVFTALDRSIARDESLKTYRFTNFNYPNQNQDNGEKESLVNIRELLFTEMARMFREEILGTRNDYCGDFAKALIRWRLENIDEDRLSILSLNWDILIDNALGREMDGSDNCRRVIKDERGNDVIERFVFIDHCMMDKQLFKLLNIPSSLTIKASGYVNFKLLKLHGSFNWLRCPNCDSLFVGFGDKYAARLNDPKLFCWVCKDNWQREYRLRPYLLTPTFLKDLSNVHYRSIWWNAGFELSEATDIIFIGYSLPKADFELRYLFSRFLHNDVNLRVVDYSAETPETKNNAIIERYKELFGDKIKDEHFYFRGADKFINNIKTLSLSDLFGFVKNQNLLDLDLRERHRSSHK